MTDFGNELFLLMTNLSQYKNRKTILRIFVESLHELYPHLRFSFSERPNNQLPWKEEVSTTNYLFGFLHASKIPQAEELTQLQNATQMLGIILQNIKQQELLGSEKLHVEELANQKTKELKEKEKQLSNIVEHSTNLFYTHTPDYKLTYVSPRSYDFFDCSPDEVKNIPWTELLTDNPANKIGREKTDKAIETGERQEPYELELVTKKGRKLWVEVHEAPVVENGKTVSVAGALVNITERKKYEKKLKESEERFKSLFYKNSSVLILFDSETGKIYDVNNKAVQFYGYSREELCSMNVFQLNSLPDEQIKTAMNKALSEKKNHFIFSHRLANGEIKDVEIYTGKIIIEGKVLIYSTIHDITEETRNNLRLKKGEEIAKIGHWEFDLNSRNVYASAGARKIYGLKKEALTIEEVQEFPLEKYRPKLNRALKMLVKNNKPYDVEFQIEHPNEKKTLDIHSVAEYDAERNVVFGIIQDITEWKEFEKVLQNKNEELRAAEEELKASNEELRDINQILEEQKQELEEAKEKAEESDRLKSAFLANMSHEIRTPMNGIMGFSQVLLESNYSKEEQSKYLEIIHSRSKHLLQIINDIVDISKIEANQFTINKESFCLNDMLQELYEAYQTDKKNYGKEHLQIELYKNLERKDSYLVSDSKRLRQILINLLGNALKFTDEGKITFGYNKQSENTLLFYVQDTGIGISEKDKKYIFDRFRQIDDSSRRNYEGTGLGLTISKSLAQLLGGNLWLVSTPGKGSTFYFTIHYEIPPKKEMKNKHKNQKAYNWEGKKILVIEDDPTSREYIKEILKPTGAQIIFKETGEEGLQEYEANQNIDLILMDVRLPGASGIEITEKIREKDKNVQIIAQTAYAMSDDRQKCIKAGANDYIAKPIDPDDLMVIMNQYV